LKLPDLKSIVDIKPLYGFFVTFSQKLVYSLNRLRRGLLRYPMILLQTVIQALAFWLNRCDRSHGFTWAYLLVARKP
jgi:ABC-type proline/glycine betaine transport system permease subunit